MRRDEELFKKLNRQKPLVKSKEIEPLSPQDFVPKRRNSAESSLEKNPEILINQPKTDKAARDKYEDTGLSYNKPVERQRKYVVMDDEETDKRVRGKSDPELVYEEKEPVKKQKFHSHTSDSDLDVFSESVSEIISDKIAPKQLDEYKEPVKTQKVYPQNDDSKLDVFTENVRVRPAQKISAEPTFEPSQSIDLGTEEKKKKLQFRHELKYFINYRDYVMLRGMLRALMSQDKFAGEDGSYFVRSLYFDDIYESCLMEKMAGTDYRSKYRIRAYNYKDDNIRFEKKFKYGQYIAKTSIRLSRQEYHNIMDGDYYFLKDRKEELASEIFLKMENERLRPRVLVDYDREAYIFPIEECRITFDKDIRGGLMIKDIFDRDAPVMPMIESGLMVLEVKFFKYLPEFIKRIINNLNAVDRCAISKYVICRKYE
jgi:hypothetical protein